MAISDELRAQILRYHFVEHWRVGTIASQLGVHHYTVERVLSEAGVERERQRQRRASKLDPYLALITETLERFPTLTAARLFDMVKARGYPGGPDHFRHCIAQRSRSAILRFIACCLIGRTSLTTSSATAPPAIRRCPCGSSIFADWEAAAPQEVTHLRQPNRHAGLSGWP